MGYFEVNRKTAEVGDTILLNSTHGLAPRYNVAGLYYITTVVGKTGYNSAKIIMYDGGSQIVQSSNYLVMVSIEGEDDKEEMERLQIKKFEEAPFYDSDEFESVGLLSTSDPIGKYVRIFDYHGLQYEYQYFFQDSRRLAKVVEVGSMLVVLMPNGDRQNLRHSRTDGLVYRKKGVM